MAGPVDEIGDSKYRPCKIRFALAMRENDHIVVRYANDAINSWSIKVNDFLGTFSKYYKISQLIHTQNVAN